MVMNHGPILQYTSIGGLILLRFEIELLQG